MATRIEDNTRLFTHVSESPPDKSLSEIAPAPTHLSAEDTHLNGWRWASERYDDGLGNVKQARKWCTLNPRGRKLDVLTLLLQLDKTDISITLALPAPYEESSLFWANDSNRSHVMRTVEKVMNSLNLSACLDVPTLPEYAMQGDEDNEERLMNVANTLAKRLKLNKIWQDKNTRPTWSFVGLQSRRKMSLLVIATRITRLSSERYDRIHT
jgi:hypothetical protein